MKTPTMEDVENASHEQLCRWWRFLPSARYPNGEVGEKLQKRLFEEYDGFTTEISKRIGWG